MVETDAAHTGRGVRPAVVAVSIVLALTVATSAGAGVWHDDFSLAALPDWEIFNLDRDIESWKPKDGVVAGEIYEPDFFSLLLLKPTNSRPQDWSDYTVRVRARLTGHQGDDDESRIGIALYDHEFDGERYLCMLQLQTAEALIVRGTDALWQAIPFPFPVEEDVWYELEASVRTAGATESISFRIDGGPVMAITSTGPFGSGIAGLVVSDAEAEFDDFEIRGVSVPTGGRGAPRAVSAEERLATTWARVKRR
ncbi:hypothetical protein HN371_16120 [Candidatus Poribacteria bacterium]|nr:hypothetical protein [Candidatus Poribacteria bacterium]MBT5536479.1 hypothetical protein [Candidatus Poribacteria bacterium]MBT7100159.1 hypothetical protein [Candidatus Poribacteria bacterium]MBT7806707.1 hypothetical protein [Candidatus Poribacteria bacterium]